MQTLNQNQFLVPHLKDPIRICLMPATQDHGMTEGLSYRLKVPSFYSAYVLSVATQCHTTVAVFVDLSHRIKDIRVSDSNLIELGSLRIKHKILTESAVMPFLMDWENCFL